MTVTDNTETSRYEMQEQGKTVFATYRDDGDAIYILHVEAPPSLRGTGATGRFMQEMLELIRTKGRKVMPVCSYAAAWIARHREFQDMTEH